MKYGISEQAGAVSGVFNASNVIRIFDNRLAIVKCIMLTEIVVVRKEGNKIQYNFNTDIEDSVVQAKWAITNNKSDYALEVLEETASKLHKRKKLIRIADTSEGGWETVRQYQANPVASDSDDESKISKAENRALRKRKRFQSKKKNRRTTQLGNAHYFPGLLLLLGVLGAFHFLNGVCSHQRQVPFRESTVLSGRLIFVPTQGRRLEVASPAETSRTTEKIVPTCQVPSTSRVNQPSMSPRTENESSVLTDEYSIFRCNCYDLHGDSFTHEYFEYKQGQKAIIVKDRLKQCYDFWHRIGANDFILDTIKMFLGRNRRFTRCFGR
ncbi:uncharacterized protein LOC128546206 [Mercenaria mercenaria]|uniref:uncharacterized protein LOC128546206 n=1 Tax=Mercenaria mercenaria TaxID=6596 RepID=UPI00234EA71A|nr:uncharacterized protein LOC128546206 [Mercenaria mercenaria]